MFQNRASTKPQNDLYVEFAASFPDSRPPWNPRPVTPSHLESVDHAYQTSPIESQFNEFAQRKEQQGLSSVCSQFRSSSTPLVDPGGSEWKCYPLVNPSGESISPGQNPWPPTPPYNLPGDPKMETSEDVWIEGYHDDSPRPVEEANSLTMDEFNLNTNDPRTFSPPSSFNPSPTFAPYQMYHRAPSYDHVESRQDDALVSSLFLGSGSEDSYRSDVFGKQPIADSEIDKPPLASGEHLRFITVLKAKTAMAKKMTNNVNQTTYLNKSQVYKMSISDTRLPQTPPHLTTYFTFIRVLFEDERERSQSSYCWGLWSEGQNENTPLSASRHAVEFVRRHPQDYNSTAVLEDQRLDGFIIRWTIMAGGAPECEFHLRFNFVSTAFSHAKGVKGVPLRLYAKTTVWNPSAAPLESPSPAEISYCPIKVFRDHGAERKFANDKAYVEKSIRKHEHLIKQSEMREKVKQRRNSESLAKGQSHRAIQPSKASSSATKNAGDESQREVIALKVQLKSQLEQSRLFLIDKRDDPDFNPVILPSYAHHMTGVGMSDLASRGRFLHSETSPTGQTFPRSQNPPRGLQRTFIIQPPIPFDPSSFFPAPKGQEKNAQGSEFVMEGVQRSPDSQLSESSKATQAKMQKIKTHGDGKSGGWIDVIDVDPSYEPPTSRVSQAGKWSSSELDLERELICPAATCFYILPIIPESEVGVNVYLAVYLRSRQLKDFIEAVAAKRLIDPAEVRYVFRLTTAGEYIKVDDNLIASLPEHQAIMVRFDHVKTAPHIPALEAETLLTDGYILTLRY